MGRELVKYRFLEDDEWYKLEQFLDRKFIPSPQIAKVAVAEAEDGELAAFAVLQMVAHLDPLYIRKKYRHAVRFDKLVKKFEEKFGDINYFSFSTSVLFEKGLKFLGLHKLPWTVWAKKVK